VSKVGGDRTEPSLSSELAGHKRIKEVSYA
jgi:hypothetical protein